MSEVNNTEIESATYAPLDGSAIIDPPVPVDISASPKISFKKLIPPLVKDTSSTKISIKVSTKTITKRVQVPDSIKFHELLDLIRTSLFPELSNLTNIGLRYTDYENDVISVTSDADLREAIDHQSEYQGVVKFTIVTVKGQGTSPTRSPTAASASTNPPATPAPTGANSSAPPAAAGTGDSAPLDKFKGSFEEFLKHIDFLNINSSDDDDAPAKETKPKATVTEVRFVSDKDDEQAAAFEHALFMHCMRIKLMEKCKAAAAEQAERGRARARGNRHFFPGFNSGFL